MPINSHLERNEIRDFTPGLHTASDIIMPPNAAQTMTDCYPLPNGGLRAWFKPTTFTTTGVDSVTNEKAIALFTHENHLNRSGVGQANDYYLVTYDSVSTFVKIYRMDQTAAGPPTTWTKIKTTAAGSNPGAAMYTANYVLTDGTRYACFALGAGSGADNGVWLVKYSDGSLNHLLANQNVVIANYQSRLICAGSIANGDPGSISFTDPGLLTNIATNKSPVDVNEGIEEITTFATFSPGDLIVFKRGAPIYLVEGDLTNYTVRQMNGSKPGGLFSQRGPQGVLFMITNDGVYQTPDGSQIFPMSKAVAAADPYGPMVFHNHYLLTGGGAVLDTDTGAWFRTSFVPNGQSNTLSRLVQLPGFFFANNASTFTLWTMPCVDGSTSNRAESYTWKSAKIRHQTGRQIEIREIEIYARSQNGATSTIAVTVNGVTQTLVCDSSGQGALTFYFLARKEYLDVKVDAASNAAGVEAPMIDSITIGAQGGHFLRQVADVG